MRLNHFYTDTTTIQEEDNLGNVKYTKFLLTGNVVNIGAFDKMHAGLFTPIIRIVAIIIALVAIIVLAVCLPLAMLVDGTRVVKSKYIMLKRNSNLN